MVLASGTASDPREHGGGVHVFQNPIMEVHHFHHILVHCMYNIIGDHQGYEFWSLEINTSIYKYLWVYLPYVFGTSVKVFKLKLKVRYKKYFSLVLL